MVLGKSVSVKPKALPFRETASNLPKEALEAKLELKLPLAVISPLISIEELIKETGKFFNYSGQYKEAPTFPGSTARRCPDITKARKELGYEPEYNWRHSLEKTLNWYKNFFETGSVAFESSFEKPDV